MKALRFAASLSLVLAAGCTCDKAKDTPTDPMTPPDPSQPLTLQPLPEPPPINVTPEALPGADGLAVVAARPRGQVYGEVRSTVTFNKPVKALETVESQRKDDAEKPFAKIEPALEGEWRWLGSASAEFVPKGLTPYSTKFTVTVFKGLKALDGAALEEDYSFEFTTPVLELQNTNPINTHRWLEPGTQFALLFNQPVDGETLVKAAKLTAGGKVIPLTLVKDASIQDERKGRERPWEELSDRERRYRNRQTRYTLKPQQELPLDSAITLDLAPELHGSEGPLPMSPASQRTWRTYGPMGLDSAAFCEGSWRCPYGPLIIYTTNRVDTATLKSRLKVTPEVEIDWDNVESSSPESEWEMSQRRPLVRLPGKWKPGTQYKIEVAAGVGDVFKQGAREGLSATVRTHDLQPSLNSGPGLGLMEKTGAPILPVNVANLNELEVQLWKLSEEELAQRLARFGEWPFPSRAADFSATEKLKIPRNVSRAHPVKLSKALGEGVQSGAVLSVLNSPQLEYRPQRGYQNLLIITDLAAHVKLGPKSSLVWVTRLSDGKPVADADIDVYAQTGEKTWSGKTNAEGFADLPGASALKLGAPRYDWESPQAVIIAKKDGDFSGTSSNWASGVEPYEFGLNSGWEGETPSSNSFIFTERGIYRPGDEVFIKGVVRYRVLGSLRAPAAGSTLNLLVTDSRGEEVLASKVKVTRFGTFSATAKIPKDSPTGYFGIHASGNVTGGSIEAAGGFRVAEYRAPQFRVDVQAKKPQLVAGDPLEAQVFSRYLFGGAMSDVQVKWSSQRNQTSFYTEAGAGFTFSQETWWWDDGSPADASGFFASGEGRADAKGTLAVNAGVTEAPGEKPYTYTFEAEVTDVNRQAVAGRASVTVHPAQFYVGLKSPSYFLTQGQETELLGLIAGTDGKRAAGRDFTVTINKRVWKSVKQKDASGSYSTISEAEETEVAKCDLKSTDVPVPCRFKPDESGFFIVRGQVKDDAGRTHSASMGLYAIGSGWVSWQRNDTDRVELVADKASYDVGDTARILIKSPYPQAKAMFTIEREGVLTRRLLDLKGSVVAVDVPVTEDMVPNVFAGVVLMRPRVKEGGIETGDDPGRPNARVGLMKINVEKKSKRLKVALTTNQKSYKPRETVEVKLAVQDAAGKPADGEVTLYVVDEAVLRLTAYSVPDPIASIFPERPLSIRMGEPLLHLVRKRGFDEKGEDPGGGGGESEGAEFRSNFKTTVLFNPTLELKGGEATTSFTLPDNLTEFRVMAVVVTQAERFGSGETSFTVNKPVMALPALPRFARVGDSFEAGVVVHAHGEGAGEVTVTAQVEGGAKLSGAAEQKVVVNEGAPREVRFTFAGTSPSDAKFRFQVKGASGTDGVQHIIPIELPVEVDAVATYGDTTDSRVEGIVPPKEVYEDRGGLTVTLASTSMAGFDRGFQQLIEYPYGCLEQQSSRLVPFIALREIAGQFNVPWPERNKKKAAENDAVSSLLNTYLFGSLDVSAKTHPDDVIAATVKSIVSLQRDDGAFRYWSSSECGDPWTSAFATMTLYRAKELGFDVPQNALSRAQNYLTQVVGGQCGGCWYTLYCGDETRVFASYVLARMKKPKVSSYQELYARRDKLSLFGKALLANAMYVGGGDRKQANALLQEILNHAKESPKGLHFEEVNSATYATLFNSDTRTTGVVLQALTDISPDHPYVGKMAKYLLSVREGDGGWRTTQEAAWSLIGLTQVLRTKEKDTPDFKASVVMGAGELLTQTFQGRSLQAEVKTIPMKELLSKASGQEQKLTFKKEGAGVLYYQALLKYAPKELPSKPLDNGLFVQRWFEPYTGGGQTTKFFAGDLVRVRMRVGTNQQRHWAAFEVPLPAGLEPVDTSLATTAKLPSALGETRGEEYDEESYEDGEEGYADENYDSGNSNPWLYGFWSPFNHTEMRDNRVVFFADHLPPGVHVASFVARATTPGDFIMKPARGELMYEPEVWGRSEGGRFTIELPKTVTQK